jgi:hypothetical protein
MIVVAGVELARGRGGFVLLAPTASHPAQVIKLPPKIFSTPPVPPDGKPLPREPVTAIKRPVGGL